MIDMPSNDNQLEIKKNKNHSFPDLAELLIKLCDVMFTRGQVMEFFITFK